jgi:hypothetical protein
MVTGYSIYVRNAGATYGSTPIWTGNPTPAADGAMTMNVTFTPAPSGVNYFTVVALTASSESGIADERGLGTPNPCRHDHCVSKTGCDFSAVPDGFSCDDASFCNGPEICVGGACDTSASRSCDDGIACSADACDDAAGRCTRSLPDAASRATATSLPRRRQQGDRRRGRRGPGNREAMNKAAGVAHRQRRFERIRRSIRPRPVPSRLQHRRRGAPPPRSTTRSRSGSGKTLPVRGSRAVQAAYLSNGVERWTSSSRLLWRVTSGSRRRS